MSILQNSIVPASAGGYEIANSLRFNDDDSAYLSRTPASAGNRRTFTISYWIKRSNIADWKTHFRANGFTAQFDGGNAQFMVQDYTGGTNWMLKTNASQRDPSAWYHIVIAVDTTQATSSDRAKIYINGELQTSLATSSYPSLNFENQWNTTNTHFIGSYHATSSHYDGYMTEWYHIDGQALDPSNFGETGDYGEWKPIKYTGTYGTNGFYLDFENSGSLGADVSGNSNNWTPTNLAATDQMLDSPTNNFCTLNPLHKDTSVTLSEGNCKFNPTGSGNWEDACCTLSVPSTGKWYWETTLLSTSGAIGICNANTKTFAYNTGGSDHIRKVESVFYVQNGSKYILDSSSSYGDTFTTGDIIGIAVDVDSNKITFYKNGVSQGDISNQMVSGITYLPAIQSSYSGRALLANFGQDSSFAGNKTAQGNSDGNGIGDFYYTPPTGYLALCTQNLPDPAVIPSEHFNTVLYTGTGTAQDITLDMTSDFSWVKVRSTTGGHGLFDNVRFSGGTYYQLQSNATSAESSSPWIDDVGSVLGLTGGGYNTNGVNYVAWNWKANGTGVSNTDGSITSTVSANVDAGFSIVSWTGNGVSAATIGHGLTKAPQLFIMKNRDTTSVYSWTTYSEPVGAGAALRLNSTQAKEVSGDFWSSTAPSSTVVTLGLGGNQEHNASGNDYIAYCFHSVDGYSKVGSYTGNGSTDGTFVYCGFRPRYIMVKNSTSVIDWYIFDTERDTDNVVTSTLYPNLSLSEYTSGTFLDITSNGFKCKTSSIAVNANGATYIFLAFAEHPFKYTNAR